MSAVAEPDAVVIDWLTDHDLLDGVTVAHFVDAPEVYPRVLVQHVGGTSLTAMPHVDRPRIQLDAYAASRSAAADVMNRARTAVHQLAGQILEAAVVTDVEDSGLPLTLPSTHPTTNRVTHDVILTVHPRS